MWSLCGLSLLLVIGGSVGAIIALIVEVVTLHRENRKQRTEISELEVDLLYARVDISRLGEGRDETGSE